MGSARTLLTHTMARITVSACWFLGLHGPFLAPLVLLVTLFSLSLVRILSVQVFWLSSYHELNDRTGDIHTKYPGHFVVISQIIHLALMVDFFYFYIKRCVALGCVLFFYSAPPRSCASLPFPPVAVS
jgi:hypothetical protein